VIVEIILNFKGKVTKKSLRVFNKHKITIHDFERKNKFEFQFIAIFKA